MKTLVLVTIIPRSNLIHTYISYILLKLQFQDNSTSSTRVPINEKVCTNILFAKSEVDEISRSRRNGKIGYVQYTKTYTIDCQSGIYWYLSAKTLASGNVCVRSISHYRKISIQIFKMDPKWNQSESKYKHWFKIASIMISIILVLVLGILIYCFKR